MENFQVFFLSPPKYGGGGEGKKIEIYKICKYCREKVYKPGKGKQNKKDNKLEKYIRILFYGMDIESKVKKTWDKKEPI